MSEGQLNKIKARLYSLPIIKEELVRLRQQLPTELSYHSYQHTQDVLDEALLFGFTAGLPHRDLELLAIAATFHDSGFLISPEDNEKYAADLAAIAMEEVGGYKEDEIKLVSRMILDTALQFSENGYAYIPSTELSKYLLDADLSNLGREDFMEKAALIANERGQELKDTLPELVIFLSGHRWQTEVAKNLREDRRIKNIELLKSFINDEG